MDDPERCATMAELRALIDRIDADLVRLLARRQGCIDRAAVLKLTEGLPARIPARIDTVLGNVRRQADAAGLDADLAEALWRMMIERAIAREEVLLGGAGRGDDAGRDDNGR